MMSSGAYPPQHSFVAARSDAEPRESEDERLGVVAGDASSRLTAGERETWLQDSRATKSATRDSSPGVGDSMAAE